jgi:hypothetical protein
LGSLCSAALPRTGPATRLACTNLRGCLPHRLSRRPPLHRQRCAQRYTRYEEPDAPDDPPLADAVIVATCNTIAKRLLASWYGLTWAGCRDRRPPLPCSSCRSAITSIWGSGCDRGSRHHAHQARATASCICSQRTSHLRPWSKARSGSRCFGRPEADDQIHAPTH